MNVFTEKYDVVIIGAGHAGCEAALACSRLGLETIIFTMSADNIAFMPCNPHIGGSSKGHLVREIDALGGEMGKNIDKTFLQSKMLNTSKGPAVHSLRCQADKMEYSKKMKEVLESQEHLTIKQAEVSEILYSEPSDELKAEGYKHVITGVKIFSGITYEAKAVILCTGTYLKSRCLTGEAITYSGPNGLQPSNLLSQSLIDAGIELRRFKTGTPARMDGNTIDYSKMTEQFGDDPVIPFSFDTDPSDVQKPQVSCWLTYTNEKTHEIIRNNIDRSPIYAGIIEGVGPRYCPSIEDKVVKFPDHERHQVFVEPEGTFTNEMYIDGMSSSLPEDVQIAMYRTVPGLENCRIVKNAYAIEYDCLCPGQLHPTLEIKDIRGLFSAGQFNGSSGYEEAAAQGLYAGINATMQIKNKPYLSIDIRGKGHEVGLIDDERYNKLLKKIELTTKEVERLKSINIGANSKIQDFLTRCGSTPLKTAVSLAELLCRPEMTYEMIAEIDVDRPLLPKDVIEQVEISIRYEGYINRQERQVEQFKKLERKLIPADIDYNDVSSLRLEARQKLEKFRPVNIGQASRIGGVNPADVSVLIIYLDSLNRGKQNEE